MGKAIKSIGNAIKPIAQVAAPVVGFALGGPAGAAAASAGTNFLLGSGKPLERLGSSVASGAASFGLGSLASGLGATGGQGVGSLLSSLGLGGSASGASTLGLNTGGLLGSLSGAGTTTAGGASVSQALANALYGGGSSLGGLVSTGGAAASAAGGGTTLGSILGGIGGLLGTTAGSYGQQAGDFLANNGTSLFSSLLGGGGQQGGGLLSSLLGGSSGGIGGGFSDAALIAALYNQANATERAKLQEQGGIDAALNSISGIAGQSTRDFNDAITEYFPKADTIYYNAIDSNNNNLAPFRSHGIYAADKLAQALGFYGQAPDYSQFYNSPGYQFQLQQGEQAINRAASTSGSYLTGQQLKELSKFNQGLAGTTFQNYMGNLYNSLSGGLSAAGQLASNQANLASQRANANQNVGLAKAQGLLSEGINRQANVANLQFQRGQAGAQASRDSASSLLGGIGSLQNQSLMRSLLANSLPRAGFT